MPKNIMFFLFNEVVFHEEIPEVLINVCKEVITNFFKYIGSTDRL